MKPGFGIRAKLLILYFTVVLVFSGTIFLVHRSVNNLVAISEKIIHKNYEISSLSEKLIENLLIMEESEKKYRLVQKENYWTSFFSAQKELAKAIRRILLLESEKMILPPVWKELDKEFERYFTALGPLRGNGSSEVLWLPETVSGKWIQAISSARSKNRAEIETATRELNHQGQLSVQYGLLGMGISTLVGLLGILLISYSIIAPLRILLREIRSLSKDESRNPIPVRSGDEFGELAQAFNEMTDRLEDEERTRSDFISTLSHETRTPLTSIRESVSMIEEGVAGAINDQQRRLLKIAHSEINRICDLLDNLMQVSRLSSGIFELQFRTMDTTAFITQTVLKILPLAKAKNINIEKQLPSQVPNLIGDPDHLPRVFLNLLDNAIKFSSKGDAVKIIVKADQKRGVMEFAIADSGPGVAKSEQFKIFKKYYRGKKVRNYKNGVGLGLSAAKDIVEAHGGVIWVNSKEGAGSTFHFTLPSEGNSA